MRPKVQTLPQPATVRLAIVCRVVLGLSVLSLVSCDRGGAGTGEPAKSSSKTEPNPAMAAGKSKSNGRSPIVLTEMPADETGVDFRHVSGNAKDKPFPAANGSGVGVIDYDLDGRGDLCFATGTRFPLRAGGDGPRNRIYRNLGRWKFADVTSPARLGVDGFSAGVAVGDIDADGLPDLFITCFGRNRLYRNQGDGTFAPVEMNSGTGGNFSTSAAFLDYNGDGLLDLYVCNYGEWSYATSKYCGDPNRNVRIFCSPKSLQPERDTLLENRGDGGFRDVTESADLAKPLGRGQGVLATDANGDGRIDLYLGNDIHPNFLFLNRGMSTFKNVGESSGTAYDRDGRMQAGMGVAGADVNRDGHWDLFVTNFEAEHHTLYLRRGEGEYHDVSASMGISAPSKPWVGWGTAFVDFDLDGWKDLIVTNGHVDDNLKEMGKDSPYEHPALVWRNERRRMRYLGEQVGSYFRRPHPGRGLAIADLDNDGDADVVITHQDQRPGLLRNDSLSPERVAKSSVTIRLIGTRSNRDAIGARVEVESKVAPRIEQVEGGGSYLSAHDRAIFVAAEKKAMLTIRITWPSGARSTVENLQPGRRYDIVEPTQAGEPPLVRARLLEPKNSG